MGTRPKCFCFPDSKHRTSSHHANNYSTQIEDLCHRFSLSQLRNSTNNFDESRIIRRGGYFNVYKGRICIQGVVKEIAIKRAKFEYESDGISSFHTEIELLCQIRHPNLLSLVGFSFDKNENISVYEYLRNGRLADHLLHNTGEPLPWKKRVEICIGVARGLHYLHAGAKRIIFHRDVKPSNILLDQNWMPKLAYFGLSLKGPHSMSKPKPLTNVKVAGTIGYIAPECMSNTLTEKCDVYSFGMVLLVVLCVKCPLSILEKMKQLTKRDVDESGSESVHLQGYSNENLALQVYNLVCKGKADEIVDPFLMGKIAPQSWEVFMDIAERWLLFEPNERPAMGEVELELEHALALQEEADQNQAFSANKNNGADTT